MEEQKRELEILNIPTWHKQGYTGNEIKFLELEGQNSKHCKSVIEKFKIIAPGCETHAMSGGGSYIAGKVSGSIFDVTMPYILENKIDVVNASIGGNDYKEVEELFKKYVAQGGIFTTSAGNTGKDITKGTYSSTETAISVGAVDLNMDKDRIQRLNYSSTGQALDYVMFQIDNLRGTSFTAPVFAAMLVLVQDFFKQKTGKTLNKEQMLKFVDDNLLDLGQQGKDNLFGKGLFILPNPDEIVISKYIEIENKIEDKNKKIIKLETPAFISEEGHFLVPARAFTEIFGADVNWIDNPGKNNDQGVFILNGKKVTLTNESDKMVIEDI